MKNIENLSKNTLEIEKWLDLLENRPASLFQYLEEDYLSDVDIFNSEKEVFFKAFELSKEIYGQNERAAVLRIPGRVNLLGMHIDHRMGSVNPIAIHTLIMIIQPRNDDKIFIYNCNPNFKSRSFSINELLPDKKIDDWDEWTKKQLELRIEQKRAADWINYFQAAALYLQDYIKENNNFSRLSGFNAVINSNIPFAVGLSSSSSLVVGAVLALMAINNIQFSDQDFIDFCGTAEWYVGTRGGKGDHAAMYIGKKDSISHITFNPFSGSYAPFPKDYCVVLSNSMVAARKTANARSRFNAGVVNYEIGFQLLKNFYPNLSHKMKYLRDVTPDRLNLPDSKIYSMIKSLPESITRDELISRFPENREIWGKLFSTHDEPEEGYWVRDACLYGISECIRSEKAAEFLKNGDVLKFGKLMNISHDGDRVTQVVGDKRVSFRTQATDELIDSLIKNGLSEKDNELYKIYQQPGWYAMSCPETDELVDIALEIDGVVGARLIGAGMGGNVAALVDKSKFKNLISRIEKNYYEPRNLPPAVGICFPVDGADFIKIE